MKHILIVVFACLMGLSSQAQSSEKAKEILDQVSSKTKAYQTIKADFSFAMENLQEEITKFMMAKSC